MRNFAISVKVTTSVTALSFIAVLITHYVFYGNEADFWCNVWLAVFGSGLLTAITSCIGYSYEKRRTMENFNYSTRGLLHFLNRYDLKWGNEKKIDFFLNYLDVDKSLWNGQLGDIYFLYDPNCQKFNYVCEEIYLPILRLNQKIAEHEFHFRWHKDGSGKNDAVMQDFIGEIESLFMESKVVEQETPDGGKFPITTVQNKLVHDTYEELSGHYYDIIYGKKAERMES